ncbi:OB-fold putative lipoprotein [Chitinophaga rhizophila]|uniref:OB-fold putative lipoprotein n=1 Tax=Chitinophaga rhizophila TaxID=2866212 RepID=A0ABS7GCI5_9BACT|nr:OB-fold putative lipoprotein [Chitinophaga rhizophila]MBW8684990.1 OB-fold putative lipoprotein [Chitinophaga rhizophila]
MTRRNTIILAGALLCLIAAGTGYYLYNKPRTSASEVKTDKQVTAEKLYEEFTKNEQQANSLYVNKVLEVTGTVADVQTTGSAVSILLSAQAGGMGGVNCTLATGADGKLPEVGHTITIKGLCTGVLMDVSIVDATIINNK